MVELICGDARAALWGMDAQSVHCCITSPPYFALRSYGGGAQEIGTEQTPASYVAALVDVFRGVWRVLRDDGTLWLVLGDSYAGSWGNQGRKPAGERGSQRPINGPILQQVHDGRYPAREHNTGACPPGVRPKSLLGIPWRVAFALQDDGWILRAEIIYAKPNPMPESVRDRPTRAHETVFMFAKQPQYYYDQAAIAEPIKDVSAKRIAQATFHTQQGGPKDYAHGVNPNRSARQALDGFAAHNNGTRNARSVWTVATAPFSRKKFGMEVEHYAAYPPELIRPMVRAATSGRGVCPACGAPWRRVLAKGTSLDTTRRQARRAMELVALHGLTLEHIAAIQASGITDAGKATVTQNGTGHNTLEVQRLAAEAKVALGGYWREYLLAARETTGWEPGCSCTAGEPVPAIVLDPFMGSGTTGLVALQEGRRVVGIDLNAAYIDLARARLAQTQPPLLSAV